MVRNYEAKLARTVVPLAVLPEQNLSGHDTVGTSLTDVVFEAECEQQRILCRIYLFCHCGSASTAVHDSQWSIPTSCSNSAATLRGYGAYWGRRLCFGHGSLESPSNFHVRRWSDVTDPCPEFSRESLGFYGYRASPIRLSAYRRLRKWACSNCSDLAYSLCDGAPRSRLVNANPQDGMMLTFLGVGNATLAQFRILGGTIGIAITTSAFTPLVRGRLLRFLSTNEVLMLLDRTSAIGSMSKMNQVLIRHAFADGFNLQMRILIGVAAGHILATALMWTRTPMRISRAGPSSRRS
jgi:hypothetical protein